MKPKITVVGVGRLGLSFALLVKSKGYLVLGCDINERYVESLNKRTFVSKEPYINELLKSSDDEGFINFTTNIVDALNYGDIIFVFVQTPSMESGGYNHKYVDQVVDKIGKNEIKNKTLVIGCTVMPYHCDFIQKKLAFLNINVVYNPEFIAQGSIIDGLKNADIVLVGGDPPMELHVIYKDIMDKLPVFKVLSLTGAEITKMAINCFLTLKISFANLIGEIITNSWQEENMESILDAIGSDSRIGKKYLSYGFPAGGVCLPRDQKALNLHAYKVGVHTKYINAIDSENNRHSEYLADYYEKKNRDRSVPFIFSQLGYKKDVDILTESYQLKLCMDLLRLGYKVDVPVWVKDADTSELFKDYVYDDKVTFGQNPEGGYRIN